MNTVCFGDSLTYGSVGYSYIGFLGGDSNIINKGINGDTTRCAFKRFKKYIEKKNKVDNIYVIFIGTNDLLMPYLTTVSPLWNAQMTPRVKIKDCIADDGDFRECYEKYLKLLKKHANKAVLVGLGIIQLKDFPLEKIEARNKIIEELALKYGFAFVDSAAIEKEVNPDFMCSHTWKHKNLLRLFDAVLMLVFPFSKDLFSEIRKLDFTVDGVHFNKKTAKLIGESINKALN